MAELPDDLPRLWTLKRYLLLLMAEVDRAIDHAENGGPRDAQAVARWCIQWRYTPVGTPRLGILHRADCWMAKGDKLTIREVQQLRQDPGCRIEPCDVCAPQMS